MFTLSLKMLTKKKAKFLAIILGLFLSTFIITEEIGMFIGSMQRATSFIKDTAQPNIWVMDRGVSQADDIKTLYLRDLYRVRGITGVAWAIPMFKGLVDARLPEKEYFTCTLIGVDDATLIGGPSTVDSIYNLRAPNGVLVTNSKQFKKTALRDTFEINDIRAEVTGFYKASPSFFSYPVIYTSFTNASNYTNEKDALNFILVHSLPKENPKVLAKKIEMITGLKALTPKQFKNQTYIYYLTKVALPLNSGIAIVLAFFLGLSIACLSLWNFSYDNLSLFATLNIMGCPHKMIVHIILFQAALLTFVGWGIGIGSATLFGWITQNSFVLPWWLFCISGISIALITLATAFFSIKKNLKMDPALVFKNSTM